MALYRLLLLYGRFNLIYNDKYYDFDAGIDTQQFHKQHAHYAHL